jgi:hypothetical protein
LLPAFPQQNGIEKNDFDNDSASDQNFFIQDSLFEIQYSVFLVGRGWEEVLYVP